jgi:putative MATE family efflux protein
MVKTFFKYGIPSVISMWMFSLYTMIDGIFIGNFVGPMGLAGVNITMPFINFIFAIGVMTAVGSSTLMSINYGEKNWDEGNRTFTTSIIFLVTVGILLTTLVSIFINPIINFLGGSGSLFPYVKEYMSTIILFSTCFIVGYALEIYIRADGNPVYPTICVISGGIVNLILDYLFMAKFGMGIRGAAIATGMSQITTSSLLIFYILFKTERVKFIRPTNFLERIKKILYTGSPEFITEISTGISVFVLNLVILKNLGEKGVSAFGIIGYISTLVVMTMIGFNQGLQPLISFNLGANNIKNIRGYFKIALNTVSISGIFFFLILKIFSFQILGSFSEDSETLSLTLKAMEIYSFAYIINGINITSSGYFTAIEKIKISTFITLLRGFVLLLPLLYFLPDWVGHNGIWISIPLAEALTLIFTIFLLRKYRI